MFQFYLSSIKSIIGVCLKRGIFKFQFYLSSIKSDMNMKEAHHWN